MGIEIFHLKLASPLYFIPAEDPLPFAGTAEGAGGRERIFCFELDERERLAFEPDHGKLLGALVSGGEAAGEAAVSGDAAGEGRAAQIPGGNYLFAQKREILSKEEIIGMAVEIQAEGLWQRLKPGKNLYLRYLFEDGNWVTQLFRPYL